MAGCRRAAGVARLGGGLACRAAGSRACWFAAVAGPGGCWARWVAVLGSLGVLLASTIQRPNTRQVKATSRYSHQITTDMYNEECVHSSFAGPVRAIQVPRARTRRPRRAEILGRRPEGRTWCRPSGVLNASTAVVCGYGSPTPRSQRLFANNNKTRSATTVSNNALHVFRDRAVRSAGVPRLAAFLAFP